MKGTGAALLAAGLAGCGFAPGFLGGRADGDPGTARLIVDRPWLDAGPGASPGALRLWAGGGTLVMASCTETPRVAAWRWTGASGFAWEENGITIAAEVVMVGPEALVLELALPGGPETRTYILASEGALC